MQIIELSGVSIGGICASLPTRSEDNFERCLKLYGDAAKARSVVQATGINRVRIAEDGVSSLDLCVSAAQRLLAASATAAEEIGAVIAVTFTPERAMPGNAVQAQRRLGLNHGVVAFDIGQACAGWAYGLYVAGMLVKATGKKVLLLDGDVQTRWVSEDDAATVPVLADAGTATLLVPKAGTRPWQFAFMSQGEGGEALTLSPGGRIAMDGFAVFKFVATEVTAFIKEFMAKTGRRPENFDAFIPHQANVYMIRQLAKSLGFPPEKLWVSGDEFGNSASASVPVTIAHVAAQGAPQARQALVAGFGGGLSASVASIDLPEDGVSMVVDYTD